MQQHEKVYVVEGRVSVEGMGDFVRVNGGGVCATVVGARREALKFLTRMSGGFSEKAVADATKRINRWNETYMPTVDFGPHAVRCTEVVLGE